MHETIGIAVYGVEGLLKQPNHKPGKAPVNQRVVNQRVVNREQKLAQTDRPPDAMHWSSREITKRVGLTHAKAHQILQAHELQAHLVKGFRVSADPEFERKREVHHDTGDAGSRA